MLKMISAISICLAFALPALANTATASASTAAEMKEFSEKIYGPFTDSIKYEGYTQVKVSFFVWPQEMKDRLKQINEQRRLEWAHFILHSEEYEDLDDQAKQKLIDHPEEVWGSVYPLRLDGSWAIFKKGKLIGYVSDFADMVDSAIIQDGSGWVFFVDTDGNLVRVKSWQS